MDRSGNILNKTWIFLLLTSLYILVCALVGLYGLPKGEMVLWFAANRTPFWNRFFLLATRLGEEHIFYGAVILSLFIRFRHSLAFALTGLLGMAVALLTKSIFRMPRPKTHFQSIDRLGEMGSIEGYDFHSAFNSFPSGHTLGAFAFFTLVVLLYPKPWVQWLGFALAGIAGISRLYLGQHFLADVSLGAFLGTGVALLIYFSLYRKLTGRSKLDKSLPAIFRHSRNRENL